MQLARTRDGRGGDVSSSARSERESDNYTVYSVDLFFIKSGNRILAFLCKFSKSDERKRRESAAVSPVVKELRGTLQSGNHPTWHLGTVPKDPSYQENSLCLPLPVCISCSTA